MTNAVVTFYCACQLCCGKGATGLTASGVKPTPMKTLASATLPFGTRIRIDGIAGVLTVQDRVSKHGVLDVFTGNHQAAIRMGRSIRRVKILSGNR